MPAKTPSASGRNHSVGWVGGPVADQSTNEATVARQNDRVGDCHNFVTDPPTGGDTLARCF
jgi:hypothetical protein